jgi:hypothetical protein
MWTMIVSRSISAAASRNGDGPGVHEHVGVAARASYARLLGDSAGAGGEKRKEETDSRSEGLYAGRSYTVVVGTA